MVDEQIMARGILDPAVLKAMKSTAREKFVPKALQEYAYHDCPLPIGQGQTISQPYIVAYMTQTLGLKASDTVLEIGTGSGYQTAILSQLVATVYTIEIIQALGDRAQRLLTELGHRNIVMKIGDGSRGWSEFAPYDAIIVTAAAPRVPPALMAQLKMGGHLIAPIGESWQNLILLKKTVRGEVVQILIPVLFVPLTHFLR